MTTDITKEAAGTERKPWDLPEIAAPVLRDSTGEIDLEQHARSEANATPCRPAQSATEPNAVEEMVIGFFAGEHNRIRDLAKSHLQALQSRFNRATHVPETSQLDNGVTAATSNVVKDLAQNRLALEEAYREYRSADRSRTRFREVNNLVREARYPASKTYHFAIILVLVLVECLANMFFFAQGNELGILGGILQASLISIANVGSAILMGYFIARRANHVKRSIRFPAIAGVVAYVAVIVAFNLLAGHYRDLMSTPDLALDEAIPHMMRDPLDLSFHSVLLLVTGLCASALGVYKGMTVDDVYPGYGDVDRDYRAAAATYEQKYRDVQTTVLGRLDDLRGISDQIRAQVAQNRDVMEQCIDDLQSLSGLYRERVSSIARECQRHLKRYRDENIRIRDGIDAPPDYFQVFPDFRQPSDSPLELPEVADWKSRAKVAHDRMIPVLAHVAKIDAEHGKRVTDALSHFEQLIRDCKTAVDREIPMPPVEPEPMSAGTLRALTEEA